MRKQYKAYGLVIESDIDLGLPKLKSWVGSPDISISYGVTDLECRWKTWDGVQYYHVSSNSFLADWFHVGKSLCSSGSSIVICPHSECRYDMVHLPILGTLLSVLLWQRGLTVLHGSSVSCGDQTVLFLGEKRQGKSTLATWFINEGWFFITDDICSLDIGKQDIIVQPSYQQTRVSPDVLELVGKKTESYSWVHEEIRKKTVDIEDFCDAEQIVSGIYILETGEKLKVEKLSGVAAMKAILQNMMINRFPDGQPAELQKKVFGDASRLVQQIPVFRLTRPRDLDLLPDTFKLVENALF